MQGVSIICSTKKRPGQAKEMYDSIRRTTTCAYEIIWGMDYDDDTMEDYPMNGPVRFFVFPAKTPVGKRWNTLFNSASYDMSFFPSDDVLMETKGWDRIARKSIPSHGVYLLKSIVNGTTRDFYPIIGTKLRDIIQPIAHPDLMHYYVDPWVSHTLKYANCVFSTEIKMQHNHKDYQSDEWKNNNSISAKDEIIFTKNEDTRKKDAEKIKEYIREYSGNGSHQ